MNEEAKTEQPTETAAPATGTANSRKRKRLIATLTAAGAVLLILAGVFIHAENRAPLWWLKIKANLNSPEAQYQLGCRFSGLENNMAIGYFRQSADNGNAKGMFRLGWCILQGIGTDRDRATAEQWFLRAVPGLRKLAEGGDVHAQRYLGICYSTGHGVSRNPPEGEQWLQKAAGQGDKPAQELLRKLSAPSRN